MLDFEFSLPTRVIFGKDAQKRLPELLKKCGAGKILLHSYAKEFTDKIPVYQEVRRLLEENEIAYTELLGVQANPTLEFIGTGIDVCRREGVDFILAVGGGSVIDSAKGIALGVNTGKEEVWQFVSGEKVPEPGKTLKVGVVLTAAAAGSETSTAAVITNERLHVKRGAHHEANRPFFTIMNPEITYTVPAFQTACGVFDSIMHVCERYFTSTEDAVLTDRISEAIMKSVIEAGYVVMEEPDNYEARATLMWGASLAHNNLISCGRMKGCGLHLIEEEMHSVNPDIVHGAGLSALFSAWARYLCKKAPLRFVRFAAEVWGEELDYEHPEHTAEQGIRRMEEFIRVLGLPETLSEIGVYTESFEMIAQKCCTGGREVARLCSLTEKDVVEILRGAQ